MALECDGGKPEKTDEVLSGFAPLSERKNKNMKNGLCLQGQVILNLFLSCSLLDNTQVPL